MKLPLLSLLIWIPIISGCSLFLLRKNAYATLVRRYALSTIIICLGLCVLLLRGFDLNQWEMQWREEIHWIPKLNIYYALGVDGFSVPLIILTCLMSLIVVLASFHSIKTRIADYLAIFLIMQGLMCGVFSALDSILFYTFWEAMLVPMFLIIGIWGGKNRIYATIKFFLYTFLGSVLLLVAIIYLQVMARKMAGVEPSSVFNILTFHALPLDFTTQKWLFVAFFIAFAVKIPMWPLHTWLPDAHVEAPTGGSVILAAILLKMGGYGFLRFILPVTPDASQAFAPGIVALSLIAIVYIALIALVQKDMKKLIAYSSISHMGFVTLGLFLVFMMTIKDSGMEILAIEGAMIQMISHGFISAALFLCIGVLYDRLHTRLIKDYGGVVNTMPVFASLFMLFSMANVGLPGTSGFVGEFLVILSAFRVNIWCAAFAASILIFGASYTLWMYKRVVLGPIQQEAVSTLHDIQGVEKWMLMLLALGVLWLGIWPLPLFNFMHTSSEHLITQMLYSKI